MYCMKKIKLTIFLTAFSAIVFAQVKWHTIKEAEALQQKNPEKKILIDFYTDWCGFCKKMDRTTWKDKEISNFINQYYIPVKFNAEKQSSFLYKGVQYELLMASNGRKINLFAYKAMEGNLVYPSFVLMNKEGQIISQTKGYHTPQEVMLFLKKSF